MAKPKITRRGGSAPGEFPFMKRSMIWIGVLVFILVAVGLWYVKYPASNRSDTGAPTNIKMPDHMVGRWQRTDGGYILEIQQSFPDGKLDVAYFNPNPINVARAKWAEKDGSYFVMVELQDVNYPGSTYGLQYFPEDDRLAGTYYQAMEGQTFDVEFERE